jgi:putative ABC transport system permease protein
MWLNLVQAVRHLRRRPGISSVGIVSLAVGIGCALACASVVNAVLIRAFPYHDSSRLVFVWEDNSKRGVGLTPTSVLNYKDLKTAATSFEQLGAFVDLPSTIDGPDGSERAVGYQATAGLLDQTKVAPLLGRLFTPAEDTPGGPDVVVLSHGLWTRRFGADRAIVGEQIRLTGVPHVVIGVMPPGFLLPPIFSTRLVGADHVVKEADFWVPLKLDGFPQQRDARMLFVLGRLKAGRSAADAQAEISTIAARLAADYAVDDFGMGFTAVPLDKQVLGNVQTLLVLLVIGGALVLIIAATNAAHLLLVDSLTMSGETAVRSALGASAWRLASGHGMLGLLWSALATSGALLVAAAIAAPVAAYTQANVPRLTGMKLDAGVAMTALAIGVLLAIAISLLPILYGRRAGSARSAAATPVPAGMSRWRRVFVVVQLAVAVVVLSTAALLYRSADRLADVNPGFVAEGVSVFELMLPDSQYGSPVRRIELQRRLLESVGDLPGRHAAATVDFLPFGGDISVVNITIENHVVADAATRPRAAFRAVSESYFEVLSIPAVDGRAFVAADGAEDSRVAVVNEAFARRFVPGENVVGRRIRRGTAKSPSPWMTVVGVVGSVRGAGLGVDPEPEVFIPYAKSGAHSTVNLIVKAALPPGMLAPAVVERIHRVDAALSPATITDMNELVARAVGQPYFYARLFGVLAGVAFLLSLAGVYSVAALGVSARSNEIAIRSCIGAQPRDIVRLILYETGIAVSAAVAAGGLGALIVQQRMAAFVYGIGSTDWTVIAASALLLSAVSLGMVYIAIRRVLVMRPMDLLRHGAGAFA